MELFEQEGKIIIRRYLCRVAVITSSKMMGSHRALTSDAISSEVLERLLPLVTRDDALGLDGQREGRGEWSGVASSHQSSFRIFARH